MSGSLKKSDSSLVTTTAAWAMGGGEMVNPLLFQVSTTSSRDEPTALVPLENHSLRLMMVGSLWSCVVVARRSRVVEGRGERSNVLMENPSTKNDDDKQDDDDKNVVDPPRRRSTSP